MLSALLLLLIIGGARPALAFDLLAGLGSNNFTVTDSNSPYSQTATNLSLNAPFLLSGSVGGQFSSAYDWTNVPTYGLLLSAPGASPNVAFTIRFYDPTLLQLLNAYQGFASGLTNTPSVVPTTYVFESGASGDLSAVGGFEFTWDAPGSAGVTLVGIVPEPSTWALLGFSAGLAGLLFVRWRKKT